jgi:tetratricopeptide (TPR) repeat protein
MSIKSVVPVNLLRLSGVLLICLVLGACGYSDELHHAQTLLKLLWTEKYKELDQEIAAAYLERRKGKLSSNQIQARFWQLQNAAPAFSARFDRWVAQQDSAHAYLARGWYRLQQAGNLRGDGLAASVPASRREAMRALLHGGIEDMERALFKDPLCAMCIGGKIYANTLLGQRDPDLVEQALNLDPTLWQPLASHFVTLSPQWGGSEGAMKVFIRDMGSRGISKDFMNRLDALFYFQLGLIEQYDKRDNDAAIEKYEMAISSYPDSNALKNLAEVYASTGRYDKAAAALERNLRENDEWDLYTIEALAQAYFALGNTSDGKRMMKKRDELFRRYRNGE